MSHAHKLDITRPVFLMHLMGGDIQQLSNETMRKPLSDNTILSYCAYTVLMEANLSEDQIDRITDDGESVAIRFRKSVDVRSVAGRCNKETVRYGSKSYKVHTKVRDRYIIFSIDDGTEIA